MKVHDGVCSRVYTLALEFLRQWSAGEISLDEFLDQQLEDESLRGPLSGLLFAFFRHRRHFELTLQGLLKKQPADDLYFLLLLSLTLACRLDAVNAFSAVNVAVSLARERNGKFAANFVNAILRRALALQGENLPEDPEAIFPAPVLKHWKKIFPEDLLRQLSVCLLNQPPFTFRACQNNPIAFPGMSPLDLPFTGDFRFYQMDSGAAVIHHPDLKQGKIYIQDPAAALAVSLFDFSSLPANAQLLDFCAAPGGKTLQLLEKIPQDARLIAFDRSRSRQKLTRQNLRVRGNDPRVSILSGENARSSFAPEYFDCILLDLPCSNTGVFRRRPDALWRFSQKKLQEIVLLQQNIIEQVLPLLRKNGFLIYSTCSIEPIENSQAVKKLTSLKLLKEQQIYPSPSHDGAYAAILQKHS